MSLADTDKREHRFFRLSKKQLHTPGSISHTLWYPASTPPPSYSTLDPHTQTQGGVVVRRRRWVWARGTICPTNLYWIQSYVTRFSPPLSLSGLTQSTRLALFEQVLWTPPLSGTPGHYEESRLRAIKRHKIISHYKLLVQYCQSDNTKHSDVEYFSYVYILATAWQPVWSPALNFHLLNNCTLAKNVCD